MTLAQEMHVSQNTIRDALYLLEQQGLVVKKSRQGAYVRDYTPDEVEEVYELWAKVESLALSWVLPNLSRDDFRELGAHLDAAYQRIMTGQNQIDDLLFSFHGKIAARLDRPQTRGLLVNLHNQARLLQQNRHLQAPRPLEQCKIQLEDYANLLGALKDKNLYQAQEILEAYILGEGASLLLLHEI